MDKKEKKNSFFNKASLTIMGIVLVFVLAIALLWHGNATSMQALPAILADVYFEGEYRTNEGEWQKIVEGEHIPATKGDVMLRGNFHMLAPDGEYVGIYSGEIPIALYMDHISLKIFEGENEPVLIDTENSLYGDSVCGKCWHGYELTSGNEEPIEILIHNPHKFGNETAIDELLSNVALWAGIDFEKEVLEKGDSQRDIGLLFSIVALVLLGTALFSTLIHVKNAKIIWVLGLGILFSGTYLLYSAEGVSFWRESVVSNTTVLGCSMMLYMLFLSMAIVHLLKKTRSAGVMSVIALGGVDAVLFALPILTKVLFYDTWLYWIFAQLIVNAVLVGCVITELCTVKGRIRWLYAGLILPLVAFAVDVFMTWRGIWKGGIASEYVFIVFFVVALVAVLKVIPQSINALTKAKALETEKIMLNSQLTESRVSTMMSQIRPHFIYNTLGSIEQLCNIDPPKAGELVHNFAKYLRGNFRELDNPKPILMSQEMEHVHHYISIENVRFPDMTFSFEMNSEDFHIPALTVQPIRVYCLMKESTWAYVIFGED